MTTRSPLRNTNVVLILILCIAGLVRFWGIRFGYQFRPDEEQIVEILYSATSSLNPHFFNYPTFYKYIVLFFYGVYFAIGAMSGKHMTFMDFMVSSNVTPDNFYYIDRCIVAFMGTATVLIVYVVTKRMFDTRTGTIASLFLGLAYLHVRDSHFGVTDVPLTFLIMCFVLLLEKCSRDKSLSSYVMAGIAAGMATSTKYPGLLAVCPMFLIHFINLSGCPRRTRMLFLDRRILLFSLALVLFYFLGTPYTLLDFNEFIRDFLTTVKIFVVSDRNILDIGWLYHMRFSLPFGLGWPLFLVSLAGFVLLLKKDFGKALVICSFPLVYYIVIGRGYNVFLRYAVPLVPFFCIAGALGTVYIIDSLKKVPYSKLHVFLPALVPILIIAPSASNICRFDTLLTKKDNRLIAGEWINKNLKTGSTIAQFGTYGNVLIHPNLEPVRPKREMAISSDSRFREKYLQAEADYMKMNNIGSFREFSYDRVDRKFASLSDEESVVFPDYIVTEESPLKYWSSLPRESKDLLHEQYDLLMEFRAMDASSNGWYDQQDAFYLPFVGFKGILRPGPNLYVFRKKAI
jgi:hypothetical protein